jgi:hypothetical protein
VNRKQQPAGLKEKDWRELSEVTKMRLKQGLKDAEPRKVSGESSDRKRTMSRLMIVFSFKEGIWNRVIRVLRSSGGVRT